MKLVIGRGNNRKVYDIPCATIVNRADPEQVRDLVENVCAIIGIQRK